MPGGLVGAAGLLGQDEVIEQLHRVRAHELCHDLGQGGIKNQLPEFVPAPPHILPAEKLPFAAGGQVQIIGAGVLLNPIGSRAQFLHPIHGQRAAHAHHAVFFIVCAVLLGDGEVGGHGPT